MNLLMLGIVVPVCSVLWYVLWLVGPEWFAAMIERAVRKALNGGGNDGDYPDDATPA